MQMGMGHDVLHGIHDLGHTGLVVGAEQGGSVGGDDGFSLMREQLGEFRGPEGEAGHSLEGDVGAVVVFDYLGADILAGCVGGGIDVGDESHGRHIRIDIRRDAAHYVSVFIE